MTYTQAVEHYEMLMRCWRAGLTNPGHCYYRSRKPVAPCPDDYDVGAEQHREGCSCGAAECSNGLIGK